MPPCPRPAQSHPTPAGRTDWTLVPTPGFHHSGQLRQGDDWNVQFLGDALDRAGDRNFLFAVAVVVARRHQLEVINHDHFNAGGGLKRRHLPATQTRSRPACHRRTSDIRKAADAFVQLGVLVRLQVALANLSELISVSAEIKRCTSCTADISKENTATGTLYSTVMFRAIVKTNAVLPIPTGSENDHVGLWKPPVMRSRSTKPVETLPTPPLGCGRCQCPRVLAA